MTDIQEQIVRIARDCRGQGLTMAYAELAKTLGYDLKARPEFAQYARNWAEGNAIPTAARERRPWRRRRRGAWVDGCSRRIIANVERDVFVGVFGTWAGLFPRDGNKIPLPPSLPLPYRTAAGRVKAFLHALARAGGGGASTGTPPGVPGKTRR